MTVRVDHAHTATFVGAIASRSGTSLALRAAAAMFFTVATAAAAQISIPLWFTPVPFTLQPLVVLVCGAALGSRLGMASQILYLLAGIAGLPVFAASPVLPQGFARILGPTGGFLLSYPLAAGVTGWLAELRFDRRYVTSMITMFAGLTIIFAIGIVWWAWFAQPRVGLLTALRLGLYPFIVADILKILIGSAVMPTIWRFTRGSSVGR
jgi:biotin transport system substrate-specific component